MSAIAAYLLTWTGWFVGENSWNRHWSDTHPGKGLLGWLPGGVRSLWNYHYQAYEFHTGLKAMGVETEMVVYPREGHTIRERGHQEDLQNRVLAWLDRHLSEIGVEHAGRPVRDPLP